MAFSGIGKLIKDLVTGTPADTDYFAFGNTDLKKISFPNLKKALGIDALNSALTDNFNVSPIQLTNSSYYPTSLLYRSGQIVYLRCSGLIIQEVPAGAEYVIAIESNIPEDAKPQVDIVAYVNISEGHIIRLYISKEGRITLKSTEKLVKGFGINLHFAYITGKALV